jgi:HEAT repeat protein
MFKLLRLRWKLHSKEYRVREAAAEALGRLGDRRAVEPLIRVMGGDWADDVRRAAIEALGKLGDARAVKPLIKALGDEDQLIRENAAKALARLGKLLRLDKLKWGEIAKGEHEDLERLGALIEALLDDEYNDEYARREATERWWEFHSDAVLSRRIAAAKALGMLGDRRAVEPLFEVLGDASDSIRVAAAEALARLGEPKWREIVKGEHEDLERLGACDDPRAVDLLIKALSYDRCHRRRTAAEVLAQIGSATPNLIGKRWSLIRQRAVQPHNDVSESCGIHHDSGIGLDFPPPPPGLDF